MGLTTCPDCGKDVSERAAACPHCGAPVGEPEASRKPQRVIVQDGTYEAGREAGRGCLLFFTSAPMAFLIFFVTWIFGVAIVAVRTGAYREDQEPSLWLGFFLFVAPVILAVVGRKVIRRVIPIIMGSGLMILFALVGLFVLLMGLSMFLGLFFHWPGAH